MMDEFGPGQPGDGARSCCAARYIGRQDCSESVLLVAKGGGTRGDESEGCRREEGGGDVVVVRG